MRIKYLEETTSTNLVAAAAQYRHGDVVVARSQSAGRGQRGNVWLSEPGANLTFSVVLEPSLAANMQFYISKITALSIVGTLERFGVDAAIKWPNDIYVGGGKIAGVLISNDIMDGRVVRSIAGVGLNVNQRLFDPALPNPVSLAQITGTEYNLHGVLDVFLTSLDFWLERLGAGLFPEIDAAYRERLYRGTGEHAFAIPGGERFRASIAGISPTGELVLRRTDGTTASYLFKEVEFVR